MTNRTLALVLLIGVMFCPLLVQAQAPLQLKSVSIDLPVGDHIFPGGTVADAINNNCLSCHSAGMVMNQPYLPRADWQAEVDKMREVYKAPVGDEDVPAIVDYLAKRSAPQ